MIHTVYVCRISKCWRQLNLYMINDRNLITSAISNNSRAAETHEQLGTWPKSQELAGSELFAANLIAFDQLNYQCSMRNISINRIKSNLNFFWRRNC